jgi:hypothetical protein
MAPDCLKHHGFWSFCHRGSGRSPARSHSPSPPAAEPRQRVLFPSRQTGLYGEASRAAPLALSSGRRPSRAAAWSDDPEATVLAVTCVSRGAGCGPRSKLNQPAKMPASADLSIVRPGQARARSTPLAAPRQGARLRHAIDGKTRLRRTQTARGPRPPQPDLARSHASEVELPRRPGLRRSSQQSGWQQDKGNGR